MRASRSARALSFFLLLGCASELRAAHAYVSNEGAASVSVIDIDAARTVASIPVGKRPRGLRLSRDGSKLYVAVSGVARCGKVADLDCDPLKHDLAADGIAVVDTRTRTLTQTLRAGSDPEQLDVTPEGRRLFVANADAASTSVVDTVTGTFITRISIGRGVEAVRLSPDGAWALAVSEKDNTASLIDTHLLQLARSVTVGERLRDVVFSADNRFAYVLGELDASVYRIGIPGGQSQRIIQLHKEDHPLALALDAPEHRLYVSNSRAATVSVVALDQPKVIAEVAVGARPRGMALTRDRALVFVADAGSDDVTIVSAATFQVVGKIPVGHSPWGVAIGD